MDDYGDHVINIVHPSGKVETITGKGFLVLIDGNTAWTLCQCGMEYNQLCKAVTTGLLEIMNKIPLDDRPEWMGLVQNLITSGVVNLEKPANG